MRYLKSVAVILFVVGCGLLLQTCCACGSSSVRCTDGANDPGPPPNHCTFKPGTVPYGAGTCSCPEITRCWGNTMCTKELGTSVRPCCSSTCGGCDNCDTKKYTPDGENTCGDHVLQASCEADGSCRYIA